MNAIAVELARKLQSLDPETAASVEQLVRDALHLAEKKKAVAATWPTGFWEDVRADWRTEPFERPPQGDFEKREDW
ncbi:MAG: hypothetical protein IH623_14610 [Verrucomicrobia bacterium]|nr:hypothetical protein [Verrucomicrobiota bacterium]